jgi:glycosyltransferase involved in cell wall biosynthesis
MTTIYNPAVSEEIFINASKSVDHPWFDEGEPPVIIGVGRLSSQKDFVTLISAFSKARLQRKMRLMILGDGPDWELLKDYVHKLGVGEDVHFSGFIKNPYPYIRAASLFVLSSRWEGFGNALVEAMALGVAVISTDCQSGPREILENGRWGSLVPVGDIEALSKAILSQLNFGPVPGAAYSVSQRFNDDRIVERYLNLLVRKES